MANGSTRGKLGRAARAPLEKLLTEPQALRDPLVAARAAHLHYVSDAKPGITRHCKAGHRKGDGNDFIYRGPDGRRISDRETLARIRSLVIPPAWTDVWICPSAAGHIQVTARDLRGRKQYRYHPRWREIRDGAKYGRMLQFGAALLRIRRRIRRDLALHGLPREKVLATVVRLLETTLIRVGNEEYARTNGSFGLTTLRNKHAEVNGSTIHFHFRGKSGKLRAVDVTDRRLAHLVKRCQELPGHELFEYLDHDGNVHTIGSADVNDYLREITGEEFTAKDFRTWAGTILAATHFLEAGLLASARGGRKRVMQVIETVAARLGNTTAVCRKCYVNPVIIESYLDGTLFDEFLVHPSRRASEWGIHAEERALIAFLKGRLRPRKLKRPPGGNKRAAELSGRLALRLH